jgi:hypothetical protein
MRAALLCLILVLFASSAMAQDKDVIAGSKSYKDTLATTRDTVQVSFRNEELGLSTFSIVAYTLSGCDTLDVYSLAADGLTWTKIGMTMQESGTDTTRIVVDTVPREYVLFPLSPPQKIRILTTDAVHNCVIIVSGKRWRTWLGG